LDELGSTADGINDIIHAAEQLKLIQRIEGESERDQLPPVHNVITEKGRQLLYEQLPHLTQQSLSN
jgi:hypothetical protein